MSWVPTPCDALRLAVFSAARRPYFRAENEALEMFIPHADDRSRSLQNVLDRLQNLGRIAQDTLSNVQCKGHRFAEVLLFVTPCRLPFCGPPGGPLSGTKVKKRSARRSNMARDVFIFQVTLKRSHFLLGTPGDTSFGFLARRNRVLYESSKQAEVRYARSAKGKRSQRKRNAQRK